MEAKTPTEIIEGTRSHRERAEQFVRYANEQDIYTARSYLAAAQVFATLAVADELVDRRDGRNVAEAVSFVGAT